MKSALAALAFLSFIVLPVCLADSEIPVDLAPVRNALKSTCEWLLGLLDGSSIARIWAWLRTALRPGGTLRKLPFPQLRSALCRAFLFSFDAPQRVWRFAVRQYHRPSMRNTIDKLPLPSLPEFARFKYHAPAPPKKPVASVRPEPKPQRIVQPKAA